MAAGAARKTARLLLRAPLEADVDPLFAIQGDPVAMRFTYCAADRGVTLAFLAKYEARRTQDGFAPWTILLGEQVIGWGGLCRDPDAPQWGVEVIYFLDPAFHGRGFATELARAALELAFEELGLPEVGAYLRPQNLASTRVLAKAGFSRIRHVAELARDEFRIDARQWKAGTDCRSAEPA